MHREAYIALKEHSTATTRRRVLGRRVLDRVLASRLGTVESKFEESYVFG